MSALRYLLVIGIIVTASGFTSDMLGEFVGPLEYKGYLVFDYPEGENPIVNIVFNVDSTIADNLIIVSVPSIWSYSYASPVLTLSGGSVGPGGSVMVTVSLNKYFEGGEYVVGSVGTTSAGEVSEASGPLLVGELYILNFLGMASTFRLPLAGIVAGLGFLELFLSRRSRVDDSQVDSVVDDIQMPLHPVVTLPEGREWDDDFLRFFNTEDAKWELSDADYARWKQLLDKDATAAWSDAQSREREIQNMLGSAVKAEMDTLRGYINDFAGGVEAYSGAMEILLRDSEGIGQLYNEWSREGGVKDIMWWVEIADAVVGVTRLAINLGAGTAKLIVRALGSADEVSDAARTGEALAEGITRAEGAIEGSADAARVEGDVVKFGDANDIYDGADFAKFDEDIARLIGRDFDDYAEALPVAAQKLGYYMGFADADRVIIQRLIVKARLAAGGKPVTFDPSDLAWLHRMAQNPNFWENLRLGATLDIDARIYRMVDDVEMAWLRTLADSPEPANAARNLPVGPVPGLLPGGGTPTMPPPSSLPPGGVTLPPPGIRPPPSPSATLPYPDAITLPHGPPQGAATLPGNGVITLPPPTSLPPGGTLPGGGVITLPHGPPPGATLPGGGVLTLPPPTSLPPGGTLPGGGVITLPHGPPLGDTPMEIVRLGDASANTSGLGGLSVKPGASLPPSPAGAADVVITGLEGGGSVSQIYKIKVDLNLSEGGSRP